MGNGIGVKKRQSKITPTERDEKIAKTTTINVRKSKLKNMIKVVDNFNGMLQTHILVYTYIHTLTKKVKKYMYAILSCNQQCLPAGDRCGVKQQQINGMQRQHNCNSNNV